MPPITLSSAAVLRFTDNTGRLADDEATLDYLFSFGFGFEEATGTVAVRANVLAVTPRPEDEPENEDGDRTITDEPAAEVEVECAFEVGGLDEFRDDVGAVRLPRQLVAHLMGITVSTARGVFIGAGRSPVLQRAPLPIGATIALVDRFVDPETYPWIDETLAMPPRPDKELAEQPERDASDG